MNVFNVLATALVISIVCSYVGAKDNLVYGNEFAVTVRSGSDPEKIGKFT